MEPDTDYGQIRLDVARDAKRRRAPEPEDDDEAHEGNANGNRKKSLDFSSACEPDKSDEHKRSEDEVTDTEEDAQDLVEPTTLLARSPIHLSNRLKHGQ